LNYSHIFQLEGRVAIVTGSGRGIGKAIALGLADAGCDIVVAARTEAEIKATSSEIEGKGRRSLAIPTDVRQSEQIATLIRRTENELGKVDILVNNAGGSFAVSTLDMNEGGWDAILRENLKSVFLCCKEAGGIMKKQGCGCIINIASIAGIRSYSFNAAYGAAKAGIINFTKTLAVDLAPYHIRVNAIAPGFIETEGLSKLLEGDNEFRSSIMRRIPYGKLGRPDDIVGAVIYLSSDASEYVTGQTIVIDGGMTSI